MNHYKVQIDLSGSVMVELEAPSAAQAKRRALDLASRVIPSGSSQCVSEASVNMDYFNVDDVNVYEEGE